MVMRLSATLVAHLQAAHDAANKIVHHGSPVMSG
jgi:hypothetical protein